MDNTSPSESGLLTAAQVAERLAVHVESVRRWTREGKLAAIKYPSGRRRYRVEDVDAMLRTPVAEPSDALRTPA
jgi:excisionase family DNA binding protein